jgi:hypothetical protein
MPNRTRPLLRTILAFAATAALLPASAPAQSGASSACPATFQVLHNDKIGRLSLPAGAYTLTVRNVSRLSCQDASDLFRQFLEDWDGKLPRPWRYSVQGSGTGTFTRGAGSSVGFSVAPASNGGGGGHHPQGTQCPGTFRVLHNDRIGSFKIPQGNYRLTLLSVGRITCSQASRYFARFLQDFDGVLPRPWQLDPGTGTFSKGHRHVGFRIKPYVPETTTARTDAGAAQDGSNGQHPSGGQSKCPATFRVLHNDSIGSLRLKKGNYNVWVKGLSCPRSSQLFAQFL